MEQFHLQDKQYLGLQNNQGTCTESTRGFRFLREPFLIKIFFINDKFTPATQTIYILSALPNE